MIGQTISHYRITSKLGEGGMGIVYQADDLKLSRKVALKFLSSHDLTDHEDHIRFLREARAAASLGDHPNICTIHDIEESADSTFIVMALIEGQTLRQRIAEDPPALAEALDIVTQVTRGLQAAHEKGIVHRDIKPGNVMIDGAGQAKITDFGLAKLADATQMTRTRTTMGTVAYMSPEQARGTAVDARSDLWSVGVVLYEMIAGRRPFASKQAQAVIFAILNEEPTPLDQAREEVPREIGWIVAKCMAKDPAERYQSAAELLEDLQAARQLVGAVTERSGRIKARPRRRPIVPRLRRAALWGVGIAAVAVLGYQLLSQEPESVPGPPGLFTSLREGPLRVVVARFQNRTQDPSLEYVADLASERILQDLASTELVEVIPLSGGLTDGDGEVAGAHVAISGAFYVEGDQLTLQARVSDARTAELVFSVPTVDVARNAPREGIERVTQRVIGGLAMRLDNPLDLLVPNIPPTYEAFREYRKGIDSFLDSSWKARLIFRQAVGLDSLFTRPRIFVPMTLVANPFWSGGFADADTLLMDLAEDPDLDEYERAWVGMMREIVNRDDAAALNLALRLETIAPDDRLVRAFKMIRQVQAREWEGALETYQALELTEEDQRRPAYAGLTRIVAGAAHELGQHAQELELRRKLITHYPNEILFYLDLLGPFAALGQTDSMRVLVDQSLTSHGSRGQIDFQVIAASGELRAHGHAQEAAAFVDWYLDRRPDRPEAEASQAQINNYASLLYVAERWEETRAALEGNLASGRLSEEGRHSARAMLGLLAARSGETAVVEQIIAEEFDPTDFPYDRSEPYFWRARYAALLGQRDEAVRMLKQVTAYGGSLGHGLRNHIDLSSLRGYDPFEELINSRG